MAEITEHEGAAFFKALAHGASFKWMELAGNGASDARLDAQLKLAATLTLAAEQAAVIEEMDR